MASPRIGEPAPDFTLPGGVLADGSFDRADHTLSSHRGAPVVLAFYPGDNTAVCTKQLCSYSGGLDRFTELGAVVWGISPQDLNSHEGFARGNDLRMPLLADTDREVARAYGVAVPGLGLRRSVFLVGPDGVLRWKHVALLGATFQPVDTLARELAALDAV